MLGFWHWHGVPANLPAVTGARSAVGAGATLHALTSPFADSPPRQTLSGPTRKAVALGLNLNRLCEESN